MLVPAMSPPLLLLLPLLPLLLMDVALALRSGGYPPAGQPTTSNYASRGTSQPTSHYASQHASQPYCYGSCYLPAPPGRTPRCARPGATYCEVADHYPAHLIQYLVDRWAFDFTTLFQSESQEEFNFRYPVSYGGHGQAPGYSNSLLDTNTTVMPAMPHRPAAVYGAPGYSSNQQWWTRYRRDTNSSARSSTRRRRQTPGTLCPTSSRFVAPQAALNTKGNWMFVANMPASYTQLVRAETCISSECDGVCSLPNGYTSRCEQQYVQKRLVALGGERLYTDTFWFPHCCVCQISAG